MGKDDSYNNKTHAKMANGHIVNHVAKNGNVNGSPTSFGSQFTVAFEEYSSNVNTMSIHGNVVKNLMRSICKCTKLLPSNIMISKVSFP